MLINKSQIVLGGAETYETLYPSEAFQILEGWADVYIIRHTQDGRQERRVHVYRANAGKGVCIPAFAAVGADGELRCFAVVAGTQGAALARMPAEEKHRAAFISAAAVPGYEYEGFEGCLLVYEEMYDLLGRDAQRIAIEAGKSFTTENADESYVVESGAVYVYLAPITREGMPERKEKLCKAEAGDSFSIPGMNYESEDRIWRISIVSQHSTAELRRMCCTSVAREKFLEAVQEQNGIGIREGEALTEVYEHEGFEESLVQYYVSRNTLADMIQEKRQKSDRAGIRSGLADVIRQGVNGGIPVDRLSEDAGTSYRALNYLCHRCGIPILDEDELRRRCLKMTPPEIAEASGFICREVVLEAGWHCGDSGMLLGALEGQAVACFPVGNGYRIYQTESGKETVLDAKTARRIHPKAYSIRRGLPGKSLTFKELARVVMGRIEKRDILWTVILGVICLVVSLLLPYLNQKIYDDYIPMGDTNMLLQMCLVTGTFMLGNVFFTLVKKLYEYRVATRAGYDIQDAVFARVFRLPENFLHQYESGDLAQRVQAFGSLVNRIVTKAVVTGISTVFALIYLFQMIHYAKKLVLGAVIMIVIYGLVVYAVSLFALKYEKIIADKDNEAHGKLQQFFGGIQKIRMAGMEEHVILEYIRPVAQQQQASIRANRIAELGDVLQDASGTVFSMVLFFLVIHQKMDLSSGSFIAFNTAFGLLSSAAMEMVDELVEYRYLKPRLEQIRPLISCAPEVEKDLDHIDQLAGRVTLDHVTFSYSDEGGNILQDVSFDVKPGEYVGIVGRSGSGKSTILKLLLGFETPKSGRVLYDGKDILSIDKHSLRKCLGVVLQNGSLISGSIYENIVITSRTPSREAAERAAEKAGMQEDIASMPMRMDTMINESAGTISGGQKQRILIARAIAGDPDILLFDEATSALDNVTQAKVCQSLEQMHVTRIVIAHRLSTIERCDRILVLDKGRIVEEGNYEQLFARRGLFYEMAKRQLVGMEEEA
ncbi:MAG: NHLP bacteriocin export ABC transporter permease/ATPase subunit [Clostridia bacterium]|nr:NHLP bacteriocin export ABC transporter permease/ATPase subunit [Clostridia bacterium]